MYKALVTLFNSEETTFWARNNLLVLMQVGLVAATASIVSNSEKLFAEQTLEGNSLDVFEIALGVVFMVGLITSVGWIFMVMRGQFISDTILGELEEIELEFSRRNTFGPNFLAFKKFKEELDPKRRLELKMKRLPFLQRYRLTRIWLWIGAAFCFLWVLLLLGLAVALLSGFGKQMNDQASLSSACSAAATAAETAASKAESSVKASLNAVSTAVAAASTAERSALAAERAVKAAEKAAASAKKTHNAAKPDAKIKNSLINDARNSNARCLK